MTGSFNSPFQMIILCFVGKIHVNFLFQKFTINFVSYFSFLVSSSDLTNFEGIQEHYCFLQEQ